MTIAEIINKVGFSVNSSDVSKVNGTINSIKSTAQKALGAIGIGLSLTGVYNFIKQCVSVSSEVEEMENKFSVVFKGMNDEVNAWAKNYADAIGRNVNDIKGYLADAQNLMVGFMGQENRQAAVAMSQAMTKMALDLASFNNIDERVAINAMQKAVMGETESAKTLGAVLNDVTRAEAMMTLGLDGKFDKLDQATKMQVNYTAIVNQSEDAVDDCERSINSYRSTLIAFQSKVMEIKTVIGQMFMPTFQKVLRIGSNGLVIVRNALYRISDFIDRVGGMKRVLITLGAALVALNFNKIIGGISGFLKLLRAVRWSSLFAFAGFLLLALLVEDFIAFMQGKKSLFGTLLEKAGIDADDFRDKLKTTFSNIVDFVLPLWEGFKKGFGEVWGGLKAFWDKHGEGIVAGLGSFIGTLGESLMAFIQWATGSVDANEALKKFGEILGVIVAAIAIAAPLIGGIAGAVTLLSNPVFQVIAAIVALMAAIGWLIKNWDKVKAVASAVWDGIVSVWNSVANWFKTTVIDPIVGFFTGLWDGIVGVFTAVMDWIKVNWQSIVLFIVNPFAGIFNYLYENFEGFRNFVDGIVQGIKDTVVNIKDSIVEGFTNAINWIKELPNEAITWGKDIIDAIVDGIMNAIDTVGDAVSAVADKIKSFLGFSEPEEGPLSNFHTYMPDMIDLMDEGIRGGRGKIKAALGELTTDMSIMANARIATPRTVGTVTNTSSNRSVVQNVNINNQFNGDKAIQQTASKAMDKSADDATTKLARGLAYAR